MEPVYRTVDTVDWITVILFSSVLFIVIAKSLFYGRFLNFIILPFNNKYIFMYNKKDKLLNWFHVFFTIFKLINFSLFLYLTRDILLEMENRSYLLVYLAILGALILFLIVKFFLQL
ncbi:MAG: DUF4271 domain-containing protein [Flavobacteriaceae bacterium]